MKQKIIEKIDEIAELLSSSIKENKSSGLLGGVEGEILFLNYYAKFKNSNEPYEVAFSALNTLFDQINEGANNSLI